MTARERTPHWTSPRPARPLLWTKTGRCTCASCCAPGGPPAPAHDVKPTWLAGHQLGIRAHGRPRHRLRAPPCSLRGFLARPIRRGAREIIAHSRTLRRQLYCTAGVPPARNRRPWKPPRSARYAGSHQRTTGPHRDRQGRPDSPAYHGPSPRAGARRNAYHGPCVGRSRVGRSRTGRSRTGRSRTGRLVPAPRPVAEVGARPHAVTQRPRPIISNCNPAAEALCQWDSGGFRFTWYHCSHQQHR